MASEYILTVLDGGSGTNVDAYRGVELQRVTSGSRFGGTEHLAYLVAELVDEYTGGVGA